MSPPSWFDKASHTRARGSLAEAQAARWLEGRGYRILVRNLVNKAGEIDLVALDGDTLCFIEVKARSSARFGSASAAVDGRKQRRLTRTAALYLATTGAKVGEDRPCRFDVLAMDGQGEEWRFSLLTDAFQAH